MDTDISTNGANRVRIAIFLAYLATIPVANWLIGHAGTVCIPDGPCLVPVGFGLSAPSGVLMIGAALVLRDAVQQLLGLRWAVASIACGVLVSAIVAPPALVIASAAAFAVAELLDLAVYTPLRQRNLSLAVFLSGLVGALADSAAFLWLAFGSLEFMAGQALGKIWMAALAALALMVLQRTVWAGKVK